MGGSITRRGKRLTNQFGAQPLQPKSNAGRKRMVPSTRGRRAPTKKWKMG